MNENEVKPQPGYQQNQPLQDNLTDNQTQTGNYQEENSENRDRDSRKEFPERTQQHDYKNPSADQIENDEEDDVDTDGQIFDQDYDTNADPVDEQSSGLRDTNNI